MRQSRNVYQSSIVSDMMKQRSLKVSLLLILLCAPAVAVAQQAPCTPGISFWKLLEAVSVGYADGKLRVDKLYAVCLPTPARRSSSSYAYDPDSGGKLAMEVKSADGKVLNTYVWFAENVTGLWEMSNYKVIGGYESIKPLAAGKYTLEFAADERPFYRFPFAVVEGRNEDPYQAAGTRYFIDGPWSEYGNLFYQRNDPQSSLRFTTWLQDRSGSGDKSATPYAVKLISLKANKTLGEDAGTLSLQSRWLQVDFNFHPNGGDQAAYIKAGDVLREDGRYSVQL